MAVTYRGRGGIQHGVGAITLVVPTGTAVGEVMVAIIETDDQAITMTDWTVKDTISEATTTKTRLTILWRRYSGSENLVTSDSGDHQIGDIFTFSGVSSRSDPWDATATSTDATSDTSASVTGVTTSVNAAMAIYAYSTNRNASSTTNFSGFTGTNLASATEASDDSTTDGAGGGFGMAYGILNVAGATGTMSVTYSAASRKAQWCGALFPEVAPTIAQNTTDGQTFTTATPAIEATASDADTSDVRYNFQVETKPIDYYHKDNDDGGGITATVNTVAQRVAQSFTGVAVQYKTLTLLMSKSAGATGNLTAYIKDDSSGSPGSTVYATADVVTIASLGTSKALVDINFSSPFTPSAGVTYWWTLEEDSMTPGDNVNVGVDSTSPTAGGSAAVYTAGAWVPVATSDEIYYFYDIAAASIVRQDVVSGTDAGFANTVSGGDTDPFNQGEKVSFTTQTSLSNDDYLWRARAKDPSGTNTYSAWSAFRTFTVAVSSGVDGKFFAFFG